MKLKFKTLAVLGCAALSALSLTACNNSGKSTTLGKPADSTPTSWQELQTDDFTIFKSKVDGFASQFAAAAYDGENFAVSPVSVYMALSLAAECANGQTRTEILDALGVSYDQLKSNIGLLYRSLMSEKEVEGKIKSALIPTNSIWIQDGTQVNSSCIDALSNYYFCYSHSADFRNDNKNANQAIRSFIKEQTRGLIDKDFELSEQTIFTLINTLYLKTVWNDDGGDLSFAPDTYNFRNADGTVKNTKLLSGHYGSGRVYEAQTFKTFYATTNDGYRIKFIVPKDGYGINEVFTAQNISEANNAAYTVVDEDAKIKYSTRCIFPEYKCGYDKEISELLNEKFGIEKFFIDPAYTEGCDFSNLSDAKCFCSKVQHVTDLTVDKKGIEGAAVTVIGMDASAAPPEYEDVYEDFVVDKAFGFIITDYQGVALFSGVIENL